MNARLRAMGFIGAIFVGFSCLYYEIVISTASTKIGVLEEIKLIKETLVKSNNLTEINVLLEQSTELYKSIES
jgi:hypothetical protein